MNQTFRQNDTQVAAMNGIDDQLVDAEADSLPPPQAPVLASPAARVLLGASLVLIAFNLRPLFSSLSVLLPEMMQATGLSSAGASLLTTLPVVCLGIFAPFAPRLAQRYGAERTLLGVMALLALGTALRGFGSVPILFAATFVAGAAIAVGNVLLPGLVKRDFPDSMALMTGLYTMALCAGAAAASGLTLPIEHYVAGSWSTALAVWAVPAFAVLLLWTPQAFASRHRASHSGFRVTGLWRDRLAWQVTLFMGLQSALAYSIFGWLAPILRERGFDATAAGAVVSGVGDGAGRRVPGGAADRGSLPQPESRQCRSRHRRSHRIAGYPVCSDVDDTAAGHRAGAGAGRPDRCRHDDDRPALT
jgi:CP family cyanate transporter-like MFS transporter